MRIARYAARTIYYRLRIVDHDQTETFSPVRTVEADAPATLAVQAFPNPFAESVTLQLDAVEPGDTQLQLHDALGRVVWQQQLRLGVGITTHTIPATAHLPRGLYRLTIRQGQQQRHLSLMHQ